MKIVFAFLFCICSLRVYPHIVLIGTGSGSVLQNDMSGLHSGDTLAVLAGRYEKGGSFKNLTGITIVNYKGIVFFGNTVSLGYLKKVQIIGNGWPAARFGFHFQDIKGDAFNLESPCTDLGVAYCEYRNVNETAFNASRFFIKYTGEDSTFALYRTCFRSQHLVHSGAVFTGSWASNSHFENVVDSISFLDIVVDSTSSDVCQVIGHSVYRMLASDWKITGPCPNGRHDAGIFQTFGNGTVRNIYRRGGWGYLWRSWNLGLNGRADSYLYNCIDLGTDNYGTIDTRIEAEDTTKGEGRPFIRGANMHILNNTAGNKKTINYVSELVIAGDFYPENGYVLEVRNNLCFHTVATGSDPIIKKNTVQAIRDTGNNLYCSDPIAAGILRDTILCYLDSSGAAIDQASVISFIKTDIDGIPRPTGISSDIGAREFPGLIKIPYSGKGALPGIFYVLGLTVFIGVIILLGVRYLKKGKVKKTSVFVSSETRNADKLLKTFKSLIFSFTFAD